MSLPSTARGSVVVIGYTEPRESENTGDLKCNTRCSFTRVELPDGFEHRSVTNAKSQSVLFLKDQMASWLVNIHCQLSYILCVLFDPGIFITLHEEQYCNRIVIKLT